VSEAFTVHIHFQISRQGTQREATSIVSFTAPLSRASVQKLISRTPSNIKKAYHSGTTEGQLTNCRRVSDQSSPRGARALPHIGFSLVPNAQDVSLFGDFVETTGPIASFILLAHDELMQVLGNLGILIQPSFMPSGQTVQDHAEENLTSLSL